MNLALLVIELYVLTGLALQVHAMSRRYGLAPALIYMTGMVALLNALGAVSVIVDTGWGVRLVTVDATMVPAIVILLLVLYDANGAAAARLAIIGAAGAAFLSLGLHLSRLTHLYLGADAGQAAREVLRAPNWQFAAASVVALTVSLLTVAVLYQAAQNHLRWLPTWLVRVLALLVASGVDTLTFHGIAFAGQASTASLLSALAVKSASTALASPLAVWYLGRYAPRFETYVGPEARSTWDILFGSYGRQEASLRTARIDLGHTEERLREADRRFRHTFELAAAGILHIGPENDILLANLSTARFLGCDPGELEHRALSSFMRDDDGGPASEGVVETLSGSAERRFVRKDGTLVWGHVSVSDVRDPTGRLSYRIMVVEDVTARRAAEERLRRMDRIEAMGRLTGGVAHDFNNLLAVVLGEAECAADLASAGKDASDSLAAVIRAAKQGARLTAQLLAYSGQQVLNPLRLEAARVLDDLASLLRFALGGGTELVIDAPPGLGFVADRESLETALLSLAANARDAMPDGGRLTVHAHWGVLRQPGPTDSGHDRGDDAVVIEFTDTGLGMSPEVASRAFEPFFTTRPLGQASGLGLSMVYGFARQSGGNVTLESRPGHGTTVRLALPASGRVSGSGASKPPAWGAADQRELPLGTYASDRSPLVLVVEDDPAVGGALEQMLRALRYRVSVAQDPAEALQVLEGEAPALVIADVESSVAHAGVDLAAVIRLEYPEVPILYVSGYSEEVLADRFGLAPGEEVLMKPFDRGELVRRVHELVTRGPQR